MSICMNGDTIAHQADKVVNNNGKMAREYAQLYDIINVSNFNNYMYDRLAIQIHPHRNSAISSLKKNMLSSIQLLFLHDVKETVKNRKPFSVAPEKNLPNM